MSNSNPIAPEDEATIEAIARENLFGARVRALTDGRHEVSRLEVIRVVHSKFDRIVVHTPRSRDPIRFVVQSHDRDAVAALLARVCRNIRG